MSGGRGRWVAWGEGGRVSAASSQRNSCSLSLRGAACEAIFVYGVDISLNFFSEILQKIKEVVNTKHDKCMMIDDTEDIGEAPRKRCLQLYMSSTGSSLDDNSYARSWLQCSQWWWWRGDVGNAVVVETNVSRCRRNDYGRQRQHTPHLDHRVPSLEKWRVRRVIQKKTKMKWTYAILRHMFRLGKGYKGKLEMFLKSRKQLWTWGCFLEVKREAGLECSERESTAHFIPRWTKVWSPSALVYVLIVCNFREAPRAG